MKANETKLQELIQGVIQFVVPLFQRPYTWGNKNEWKVFWDDVVELYNQEKTREHFIGSIVTMPAESVPEGVTKYLLIDGQQRLTTVFVLLTVIRDKHRINGDSELADEINETYLINKFKKNKDYYKLLPTHKYDDRTTFFSVLDSSNGNSDHNIFKAYQFFERKIRQQEFDLQKLTSIIVNYLTAVSIVLGKNDNPYLVFESLNAKGTPLNAADLIRNFFFMRINVDSQEEFYNSFWTPMERRLADSLTEYIRHFLMKDGTIVSKGDVYFTIKDKVTADNAIAYLKELNEFSGYYEKLLNPEKEQDIEIRQMLLRLNRIEVTTSYPLLLNFFSYYNNNIISSKTLAFLLKILENYLIRRFISAKPTRELNKLFPSIIKSLAGINIDDISEKFKEQLTVKGYPRKYEFDDRFLSMKFYGGADLLTKTRLILESIESSFEHKENVSFKNLTIEHVMPQTLNEEWQNYLGEDWADTHDVYLHTIGNLTLTAYNSELSNYNFDKKKEIFNKSHLEINKYFSEVEFWNKDEIENRAKYLLERANQVWEYFGYESVAVSNEIVTGSTPTSLKILGQSFSVKTWRDVLQKTLEVVIDLEPEKMVLIENEYPRFVGKNKNKFRAIKELPNGYYFEVHLSAQSIYKLCNQIIDTIGLTSEDWQLTYSNL